MMYSKSYKRKDSKGGSNIHKVIQELSNEITNQPINDVVESRTVFPDIIIYRRGDSSHGSNHAVIKIKKTRSL